jgi:hypothetical protein
MNAQIETTINQLWDLHDEAQSKGDEMMASMYAAKAFQLLETIPENAVYLRIEQ